MLLVFALVETLENVAVHLSSVLPLKVEQTRGVVIARLPCRFPRPRLPLRPRPRPLPRPLAVLLLGTIGGDATASLMMGCLVFRKNGSEKNAVFEKR